MNLIEQMGGYDFVKKMWIDGGSLHGTQLEFELLEYRRAHNIFEVGDKVVFSILGNEVIQYADWLKSQNQDLICHATDAEIKAGHRL